MRTGEERPATRSSYRLACALLLATAGTMAAATVYVHVRYGRPILDPEGSFLGPSYVRIPMLVLLAMAVDLVPIAWWQSRSGSSALVPLMRDRWRSHWTRERLQLVVLGVACFYVTYVGYRNLKSDLPFVRLGSNRMPLLYDNELHKLDRVLFFGHDPSDALQAVLGTHAAYVLSPVYLFFLPLVPVVITLWAVWSRNISYGYWFVASQCLAWALGTLSYYLLPTLGPGIAFPSEYQALPHTTTTGLMEQIVNTRGQLVFGGDINTVNSIAGFASLHTCITLLVALMINYTLRNRALRIACWVYFGLVVVSTLYFGWHYLADDIAGAAIAIASFWLAAVCSGQRFGPDTPIAPHPRRPGAVPLWRVPLEKLGLVRRP